MYRNSRDSGQRGIQTSLGRGRAGLNPPVMNTLPGGEAFQLLDEVAQVHFLITGAMLDGQNLFLGSDQGGRCRTRTCDLSRVKVFMPFSPDDVTRR
jgi:hypothetical protein